MRRAIYILLILVFFILVTALSIKPLVIFLVKQQLKKVFIHSSINIRGCNLKPLHQLSLSDIEIKREPIYALRIKEAKIQYSLSSIITRNILKFSLKDALITVNLGQSSILNLRRYLTLKADKKSIFLLSRLKLSNLDLNLKSADLNLKAKISAELNFIKQIINHLKLKIDVLQNKGFQLENAYIEASQNLPPGLLHIDEIKYGKFKIEKIKSNTRLDEEFLHLDSLSAKVLGGEFQGKIDLITGENIGYSLNLKFINLDLEAFVDDFNLNERFELNGKIGGTLALEGSGPHIEAINGDFTSLQPGGVLTIKDNRFLENLARKSNQPLDILVESFKNYHYNKGMLKLFKDEGNLILDVALDSEAGKRNLNITVHDFKLRKEER